jgi:hypothetical protein
MFRYENKFLCFFSHPWGSFLIPIICIGWFYFCLIIKNTAVMCSRSEYNLLLCLIKIFGTKHYIMHLIWYEWYDMTWRDKTWHDVIWYDMISYHILSYDIWHDMTWYDMKWNEMIWYMIWYYIILYYIFLTAVGLTPITVHITHKQYTKQHNETEYLKRNIRNNKNI